MNTIAESLETPINYECDVCVCGGGVAGIAAALSAARGGAKTILLEKSFMLGGLATSGLVTIYLPICDGKGHQISFGIAEELLKLSIEHGYEDLYPSAWLENGSKEDKEKQRYQVQYNPQLFAISAERLLKECGVKILYGVSVTAVKKSEGKISHIIFEGKAHREAIKINKSVVDATGDADICVFAGEETALHGKGNSPAYWYYSYGNGKYSLNMCGFIDAQGSSGVQNNDEVNSKKTYFSGIDTEEISNFVQVGHSAIEKNIMKKRAETPDLIPVTIATIPQVRMTRRINGVTVLDDDETKFFNDSVGLFSNWCKSGPYYELPLSSLYGKNVKNLITAGRNISANDAMWNITRVIPVCAVSGEAAGLAAAMTDDFSTIDICKLQQKLRDNGVLIHRDEVK